MEHRHSEYWRLVAGLRSTQIWIWPPCKSLRPVWPRAFFCHSTQWQMGEMLHSRLCKEGVLCMRSVWSARHRAHCRAGLGADSSISCVTPSLRTDRQRRLGKHLQCMRFGQCRVVIYAIACAVAGSAIAPCATCIPFKQGARLRSMPQSQSAALVPAGGTVTRVGKEVASTALPGAVLSISSSSNV